jgi:hypothetical protein
MQQHCSCSRQLRSLVAVVEKAVAATVDKRISVHMGEAKVRWDSSSRRTEQMQVNTIFRCTLQVSAESRKGCMCVCICIIQVVSIESMSHQTRKSLVQRERLKKR